MSEAEGKEKQDDIESVRCQLAQYQPALLSHWHSLDEKEGANFGQYLRNFDFAYLATSFKCALEPKLPSTEIHPIPAEQTVDRAQLGEDEKTRLTNIGLKAIAEGRVAAVVLAGGQASRLGSVRPKGVIPLGTGLCPDGTSDSLLFVQASQIVRLQSLAAERFPAEAEASGGRVTWLVMASKSTESATRDHLTAVLNETGLSPSQMLFFTQNEIPAFDFDGHAFLKDDTQLVTAPDGNGGFYDAVRPLLPELEQRGVTHVHIYCVDNILCRVADPTMVGCAIDRETDCALKAIEKRDPAEQVGHVCLQNGHVSVLEYSEISRDLAERRNAVDPAKLFLNAGSIANHLVTLDFLKDAVANKDTVLPYHVACKRIPFWDMERKTMVHPTEPNGIKLERFIFDAFSLSKKVLLWMVPAEEEFSPLKNAECVGRDCLSTCLRALHSSHGHLIREACLGIVRAGAKINC